MRMTDTPSSGRPPDFSTSFRERLDEAPADDRVYRVALELTEPTRVSEIATRAECAPNTARRHLTRLADIGVLTQVGDDPIRFERNEAYFEWRRQRRLASLSEQEYKQRLGELLAEDAAYRDTYGVDRPSALDPLDYHDYGDPEQVWLDITSWEAVQTEIRDLRQAHDNHSEHEGLA